VNAAAPADQAHRNAAHGNSAPIGIFDSGLGGLTVVREILGQLPAERVVYVGDTGHAPYGERTREEIRDFSLGIGRFLTRVKGCRAIVVACNTATAAGVDALRSSLAVPIVGMEPGVKPAVAATRTGRVAVLATVSTLNAGRFATLVDRHARDITVFTQPCPGLVTSVEAGDFDSPAVYALVSEYVRPLLAQQVDTLVLGCTHFPLLRPVIAAVAGPEVAIIDTAPAVVQQLSRLLADSCRAEAGGGAIELYTTGTDAQSFVGAAREILGETGGAKPGAPVRRLVWKRGELFEDADTTE
jgi:glutamate racemase